MVDSSAVLAELKARGLFNQCTDESALLEHLKQPVKLYTGYDPSADSLTIGNLVPIMMARVFARHGHTPVVLLGGATGRIGDPSGKDAERTLMGDEQIAQNTAGQGKIFEALLGQDVQLVNNDDWFSGMSAYTFLRDVGKHFSVNQMMARDSVRNRLQREEQGISYTEFSYMLLQAYDFLHLFRDQGITLQTAGADQWGNIVSGVDIIRRVEGLREDGGSRAFGLTVPLLTKADGGKFGKTEAGAIWLSHQRVSGAPGTSPYGYYQFWLNTADVDVERYLKIFTDLPLADIAELVARHEQAPHAREAQRILAQQATSLLHGQPAMQLAEDAGKALFSGEVAGLDEDTLTEVFGAVSATEHSKADLDGEGPLVVDILAQSSLVKSKGEARKHLVANAISVNGKRVEGADSRLSASDLLHGSVILLRRGKKAWHVTRWS